MQSDRTPHPNSQFLRGPALISLAIVLIAIILFGTIRYRLRQMPLERDEGEYAYAGQLLLQGIPPYKLAYNMKLPGIYAAYAAVFAVFGETPAGIHLGLLLVNAATTLLLYLLTTRLFGRLAGVVSACCFALLSTSTSVMGFQAHATNFVVLPALIGILLLLRALDLGYGWLFLASGLFSGLAFQMKQHGAFFALFCFFYLITMEVQRHTGLQHLAKRVLLLGAGVVLLYALACLLLYRAGVFHTFWFWTFSYAAEYSKMGLHRAIRDFILNFSEVLAPAGLVWIIVAVGLTAPLWNAAAGKHSSFLYGFFACSFLALCPGVYFRLHYFVLLLPAAAILAGVAVSAATEKLAAARWRFLSPIPLLILLFCFAYAVFQQRLEYFSLSSQEVFQDVYEDNPFVAAITVGDYLRRNSAPNAQIAVLGSEPEIYFYARRHSATGYLYMYSVIVRHKYTVRMRQEMLRELNANRPDYVVYVDEGDSWGGRAANPETIAFLASLHEFMDSDYEKVGAAELGDPIHYVWGEAARDYQPQSSNTIYILKRKSARTSAVRILPDNVILRSQ